MQRAFGLLLLLAPFAAHSELLDRIAIIVDDSIVKDSDIRRDIHLTQFLDNEPLRVTEAARKRAAQKLIDQALLREEIRAGGYRKASGEAVEPEIEHIEKSRHYSESGLKAALAKYNLDEEELREGLRWQLTVLQFIDARFKAAAVVQESAVNKYYDEHTAALGRGSPKPSAAEMHAQSRDILVGEEVNRLLDAWLAERRKEANVSFLEDGLL